MGREEGGGFRMGIHVYLWRIYFDIWQNQYNIVKFKNKIKLKKKEKKRIYTLMCNRFLEIFHLATLNANIH